VNFPITSNKQLAFLCAIIISFWWWLPDQLMGPYNSWNPHALMEFVLTLFVISFVSQWVIRQFGAHHGLLIMGLMGGFASSTATIHSMGSVAKAEPSLAARAALSGVLSNIATMIQLLILLKLLAPNLLASMAFPIFLGLMGVTSYAVMVQKRHPYKAVTTFKSLSSATIDWKSLALLTTMVVVLTWVSAALSASYGQNGLWLGSALSGLVDAHAIVPTLSSLLGQEKISSQDAAFPLLISLTANSITKSLLAFQSGGWIYARRVSIGIWVTTMSVWLGYFIEYFFVS
jgi:uncharacterized membrane protein (DUF4010 family)